MLVQMSAAAIAFAALTGVAQAALVPSRLRLQRPAVGPSGSQCHHRIGIAIRAACGSVHAQYRRYTTRWTLWQSCSVALALRSNRM